MVSDYKRAAMLMEEKVNFAAVNCEKNRRLCQHFGIQVIWRVSRSNGTQHAA